MSLVEQALKKMQEAAARPVPAPGNALGQTRPRVDVATASKASDTATHRALAAPPGAPLAPARVVHLNPTALRSAGLMPPEHQERQIAQQYRQIKRPLVASALGRGAPRVPNGHLIMLASAMPGEGKTFTAINLALSMSMEKDVHILLVDADVAKPHISKLLGVADAPGLLDVLRDPALDIESVILPSDVPNLSILPAGTRSEHATELLASARMEQVVRALARDEQRIAVIDSPPLLLTTESHALMQVAGQVVVVVRAGVTSQQMLLDAISYLGGHSSVSLVLNQAVASSPSGYYYYGYGDSNRSGPQSAP